MDGSVTVHMAAPADKVWELVADVRSTACEPGREFGFDVLIGDRAVNTWHYRFTPTADDDACAPPPPERWQHLS